ncbi:winged helix-turn-helix transcriptional regulator [Mycolicibacterium arenosum]|uniref:Helix-turn-helix transcriptional regulator n=1 Tax=Mycolicibacterium arenosum TaxID=2952157 RepID=A0ABT1M0D7_9MYCO|nr:helix-turn-helix domain-containing protein [Mycolicibacterium sp. CAU 1645]MCP9272055.1 helix-turn-helix transcriptional regulator [Mycolicibacterium sp. CAU 1645]
MAHAVGLLGDRWTLLLVREALAGAERYEQFQTRLGMSDNTLSRKLRDLVQAGLLERTSEGARPVYRLTSAGADLASVLAVLGVWNQRWFAVPKPRRPPPPVVDAAESLGLSTV